jgi:hypothetical protein
MAEHLVFAVEPRSVGAQQPLHSLDQIASRRFQNDMKMVAHQAEGMHLPIGLCAAFTQGSQEEFGILFITKDRFEVIASIHHVVNRSRVLDTQLASHAGEGEERTGNVKNIPSSAKCSEWPLVGASLPIQLPAICECAPLTPFK